MKNLALRLASISLSLGGFCFALVSISIPSEKYLCVIIPNLMRALLAAVGLLSLISTALIIDWTIDSFLNEDWDELENVNKDMNEKMFCRTHNYVFARARIFGGGYLLLSLAVSGLIFLMTWTLTFPLSTVHQSLSLITNVFAVITAISVFVKMMTRKLLPVVWSSIIFGALIVLSVMLNVILLNK